MGLALIELERRVAAERGQAAKVEAPAPLPRLVENCLCPECGKGEIERVWDGGLQGFYNECSNRNCYICERAA